MSVVDRIGCPKCKEPQGRKCRALTTGRTTDTHQARYDAYWQERDAAIAAERRGGSGEMWIFGVPS